MSHWYTDIEVRVELQVFWHFLKSSYQIHDTSPNLCNAWLGHQRNDDIMIGKFDIVASRSDNQ